MRRKHIIAAGAIAVIAVGGAYTQTGGNAAARYLPDPRLTPGVLNPAVAQNTIQSTICVSGYTATIRPPVSESNHLKQQAATLYKIKNFDPAQYEGDHLISLELGGAPDDIANLWNEPHSVTHSGQQAGSHQKDSFENFLKREVCSDTITLSEAQDEIRHDWFKYWIAAGKP